MTNSLIEQFRNAKKISTSWIDLTERYRRAAAQSGMTAAEFDRQVSAIAGYKEGSLRRAVPVLDWLERLPQEVRPARHVADANATALSHIKGIERLDPERARQHLVAACRNMTPSVAMLREELQLLQNGKLARLRSDRVEEEGAPMRRKGVELPDQSQSALDRHLRTTATFHATRKLLPAICGDVDYFMRPVGANRTLLRVDAVAALKNGSTDGFDFVFSNRRAAFAPFAERLNCVALAATFFRRYFLVFSEDSDRERAETAVAAFANIEAANIGVIMLRPDGAKPRVLLAPSGLPSPDRRHRLQRLCHRGRWRDDWVAAPVVDEFDESREPATSFRR